MSAYLTGTDRCDHGLVGGRPIRSPTERRLGYLRVLEARSATTTTERLRTLAGDEIRPVRLWTARNWNTPPDALDALARDTDSTVRWNALLNPRTTAHTLDWIALREATEAPAGLFIERGHIVHHPNTPADLRRDLLAAGACRTCPDHPCTGFEVYRRPNANA